MHPYAVAVLMGVLAPWAIMGASIRSAFSEGGLVTGLGTWFGGSLFTIPIMLFMTWAFLALA